MRNPRGFNRIRRLGYCRILLERVHSDLSIPRPGSVRIHAGEPHSGVRRIRIKDVNRDASIISPASQAVEGLARGQKESAVVEQVRREVDPARRVGNSGKRAGVGEGKSHRPVSLQVGLDGAVVSRTAASERAERRTAANCSSSLVALVLAERVSCNRRAVGGSAATTVIAERDVSNFEELRRGGFRTVRQNGSRECPHQGSSNILDRAADTRIPRINVEGTTRLACAKRLKVVKRRSLIDGGEDRPLTSAT